MKTLVIVFLITFHQASGFIKKNVIFINHSSSSKIRPPVSSFQSSRAALHFRGYLELKRSIRQILSSHPSSGPKTFNHQKLQIVEELLEVTKRELIILHTQKKLSLKNMTLILGESIEPKNTQQFKDQLNELTLHDQLKSYGQSEVKEVLPVLIKNIEHLAHQLDSRFKINPQTNISFNPQLIKHP